ncbi:MAG: FAA hydrolase family protein [Candidatus Dadabacteria bacterium]|nr:MAG: FAA hydrolase family protein [Candidatus Dadabacteria bacterium]
MKLARFTESGRTRIGVVDGERVVDLEAACPELPREMTELLAAGPGALERARKAAQDTSAPSFALAEVRLEAPIARPPKFLGVGLNYADHAAETGRNPPEFPVFFNKQSTCVIGPGQPIVLPRVSQQVDYEGELGLVIGRRVRGLSREQAREAIAGYLVVNDVSARDWQFRAPTMTLGKSFDTHGPIGPWIVTADEVGDPHCLELRTYVSGELRQHSNTRNLIFDCYALVELLSTVFTLEPGDIVSTGTPAGVGMAASPPRFLRPGDVVRIEIERIGALENPVIAEA